MGNSLLDILVFGRRAGAAAAAAAKAADGTPDIGTAHVKAFVEELKKAGVGEERKSPMLLPDYREPDKQRPYSFLAGECLG